MQNVKIVDLEVSNRLILLFNDAVRRGLVSSCAAHKLAFFAAAEHSRRIGKKNPSGLFASLVRRRCYGFITQDEEEIARRKLIALEDFTGQLSGVEHRRPEKHLSRTLLPAF